MGKSACRSHEVAVGALGSSVDTTTRLRHEFGPEVSRLKPLRPAAGLAVLGVHLGVALGAALVCQAAIAASRLGWLLLVPTGVLIGSRMRALGNIVHECTHNSFVRSSRWNRVLGELLCVLDFGSFTAYRRIHLSHHRYLGDTVRDLDLAERRELHLERPLGRLVTDCLVLAMSPRSYRAVFNPTLFTREDHWFLNAARVAWLGVVAFAVQAVGWPVVLYAVLPYLTSYQVLKGWSDAIDHGGLVGARDGFERSRNHILPVGALNWLFLPRNDAYHLVHHLFPRLPTRYYSRVHAAMLGNRVYASRDHVMPIRGIRSPALVPSVEPTSGRT